MIQEEYQAAAENVIYLAACMVNGEKPDTERVAQEMGVKRGKGTL